MLAGTTSAVLKPKCQGSHLACEVEKTFAGRPMPAMPAQEAKN